MQYPTGYAIGPHGEFLLTSFWKLLLNKWALWAYAHNMLGAVQTVCFVMAAVGAFYLLAKRDENYGRTFLKTGVLVGAIAASCSSSPPATCKEIDRRKSAANARGHGRTVCIATGRASGDSWPARCPKAQARQSAGNSQHAEFSDVSQWKANVKGLEDFPASRLWPDRIPLLYYSYHVMVGLGTIFIAVMVMAALLLWRGKLYDSRWIQWMLMVCVPLPYIANTAGWMTAEFGRQPWLIYGMMRTAAGVSPRVGAGQCVVHADRIYGHVRHAGDFVAFSDLAGD